MSNDPGRDAAVRYWITEEEARAVEAGSSTDPLWLPLSDAERIAEQTLAAIQQAVDCGVPESRRLGWYTREREQVASDLIGLQWCDTYDGPPELRVLFAEGLLRMAKAYGVEGARQP